MRVSFQPFQFLYQKLRANNPALVDCLDRINTALNQITIVINAIPDTITIPPLPVSVKGDLLGYDIAPNRVPVGADGTVLTADSTAALGVRYIAPTAAYAGITQQSIANPWFGTPVTARAVSTVYQNLTGKPLFVTVSSLLSSTTSVGLFTDAVNPPTTLVDTFQATSGVISHVSGWILPNNYYSVSNGGSLQHWTEWV